MLNIVPEKSNTMTTVIIRWSQAMTSVMTEYLKFTHYTMENTVGRNLMNSGYLKTCTI